MKLLMHICCAPCANLPIDVLRADGIDLTGYWYNPNIHPFTEYRARRNCLQEYAKTIDLPLLVRDDYGLRPFVREVAGDPAGLLIALLLGENAAAVLLDVKPQLARARLAVAEHGAEILIIKFPVMMKISLNLKNSTRMF